MRAKYADDFTGIWMRYKSKQSRFLDEGRAALNKIRRDFVAEMGACAVPWCRSQATDCHEICRGAHRRRAIRYRCTWLALCRACHEQMGDYSQWPIARQYALKQLSDPKHYDRAKCNEIRGRAPGAITQDEVNGYLTDLQGGDMDSDMVFVGIDPGKSGGIAIVGPTVAAWKMPETPADLVSLVLTCCEMAEPFAVLERVGAMPKQGVASTFKFGRSFGMIEGVIAAVHIPYELVAPSKWQGELGCRSGGDKNITKRKAQQLFPSVKVTHAVADALLLAEYARRLHFGRYGPQ